MLTKAKTLKGYTLASLDGEIGKVKEFYFDDEHWVIRYLIAETGGWLTGRQVLISPYALRSVDTENKVLSVNLTKTKIEDSPSLINNLPVSRQFEEDYYGFYQWPNYWGGPSAWGPFPYIERDGAKWRENLHPRKEWDPHLRSTQAVSEYRIQAKDGEIGHVADFLIDDETWAIRYLVINTHNWWPGKKILVSPQWIERVSWSDSKVYVNLRRQTIRQSPEYSEDFELGRDYEDQLYRHYDRQRYWEDQPAAREYAGIKCEEK